MAEITSEKFLDGMRALTGHAEDASGGVRDRTRGMVAQVLKLLVQAENVTLTDTMTEAMSDRAVATGGGQVVRAVLVGDASFSVSQTDHIIINLIKRTAPTWSTTLNVGTLTSTTDGLAVSGVTRNGKGVPVPFAVSTLTDNITVNTGDTFYITASKVGAAGANAHRVPLGAIFVEIR